MKNADESAILERIEQKFERIEAHLAALAKPKPESFYWTRSEAAAYLGISLTKLDQLSKKGILKKHRFGGLARFRRDEIEKVIF